MKTEILDINNNNNGGSLLVNLQQQPPSTTEANNQQLTSNQQQPPPNNATGGRQRGRRKKIRTEPIRPICPQCEKQFSNQSALTKHKLTHSDERKFACKQCSKAFKRHDHLTGHMQTHSNRKPFNCTIQGCDKTYCDARSLRRHKENIHHIVQSVKNSPSSGGGGGGGGLNGASNGIITTNTATAAATGGVIGGDSSSISGSSSSLSSNSSSSSSNSNSSVASNSLTTTTTAATCTTAADINNNLQSPTLFNDQPLVTSSNHDHHLNHNHQLHEFDHNHHQNHHHQHQHLNNQQQQHINHHHHHHQQQQHQQQPQQHLQLLGHNQQACQQTMSSSTGHLAGEPHLLRARRMQRLHSDSGVYSADLVESQTFMHSPIEPHQYHTNSHHFSNQHLNTATSNNNNNNHLHHHYHNNHYQNHKHTHYQQQQAPYSADCNIGPQSRFSFDTNHIANPAQLINGGSFSVPPRSADSVTDSGLDLNVQYEQQMTPNQPLLDYQQQHTPVAPPTGSSTGATGSAINTTTSFTFTAMHPPTPNGQLSTPTTTDQQQFSSPHFISSTCEQTTYQHQQQPQQLPPPPPPVVINPVGFSSMMSRRTGRLQSDGVMVYSDNEQNCTSQSVDTQQQQQSQPQQPQQQQYHLAENHLPRRRMQRLHSDSSVFEAEHVDRSSFIQRSIDPHQSHIHLNQHHYQHQQAPYSADYAHPNHFSFELDTITSLDEPQLNGSNFNQ